jgi:hypothetical protein
MRCRRIVVYHELDDRFPVFEIAKRLSRQVTETRHHPSRNIWAIIAC